MSQKTSASSISQSRTLADLADFWDTHSLADFEDETYAVDMTFEASARCSFVGIEPELMEEIRHIARERRVSTQTLINVWLRQRVEQLSTSQGARQAG